MARSLIGKDSRLHHFHFFSLSLSPAPRRDVETKHGNDYFYLTPTGNAVRNFSSLEHFLGVVVKFEECKVKERKKVGGAAFYVV